MSKTLPKSLDNLIELERKIRGFLAQYNELAKEQGFDDFMLMRSQDVSALLQKRDCPWKDELPAWNSSGMPGC